MPLVLVVDDLLALAEQYAYDIKRVGGYDTMVATGGQHALDMIASEAIDCVILDLEMPGVDGFQVLRKLSEEGLNVPVIVYTGAGDYDRCMKAIKLGAYSFIDKAEPMARVVREIETTLERARLETEVRTLRRDLDTESPLIGSSAVMQKLKEQIARVAPIPSSVLVIGESGTGKELVARELHRLGPGPGKPFVALNCAALPENLVESELFGHERGAFTGASRLHKGAFEMATGGTLFLDEIGEMPLPTQAKLLRVLEENKVMRVGGERSLPVDARVVAATNRSLESEIEARRFRQDLFYRLNVHILQLPPLRDRRSDIAELTDSFLTSICARLGIARKTLGPDTLDCLMAYEWRRNNVRELRNIIERMIISSDATTIGIESIPAEVRVSSSNRRGDQPTSLRDMKVEAERQIVISALERNDWHITNTARELGLADHASLLKIMRRHNLKQR